MDAVKLRNLEKRVAELEAKLAALEVSPWQSPFPNMQPFTRATSKCSKCGLDLSSPMGYVCSDPCCPTGLGPIMCGVKNEQTL